MPIKKTSTGSARSIGRAPASTHSDDQGSDLASNSDGRTARPAGRDRLIGLAQPPRRRRSGSSDSGNSPARRARLIEQYRQQLAHVRISADRAKQEFKNSFNLEQITSIEEKLSFLMTKSFVVPRHIEFIGSNVHAPELERLEFPGGMRSFTHFGVNFNAPSLLQLYFLGARDFKYFGKGFNAPNMRVLHLTESKNFREFPGDMSLPMMRDLSLENCINFERFPNAFFAGMKNLSSLMISGTGVELSEIPRSIQEKLVELSIPEKTISFGKDLTAARLKILKFCSARYRRDSQFTRFERNFKMPEMVALHMRNLPRFEDFGSGFKAPKLTSLKIQGSKNFENFPEGVTFPLLQDLDLTDCANVRNFPVKFFEGMRSLRELKISGTKIKASEIPESVLKNLIEVELPDSTESLGPMEILPKKSAAFPGEWDNKGFAEGFEAPRLEIFKMRGCKKFKSFPKGIGFPSLKVLDLQGCENLEKFPENFFDGMKDLSELRISGTKINISDIPKSILENLLIISLPEHTKALGELHAPRLRTIIFGAEGRSQITHFEDNFKVPSITFLNLGCLPRFQRFGKGFEASNLLSLSLSNSRSFRGFPDDIKFSAMSVMDFTNCENFRAFPEGFFDDMKNLRSLMLKGSRVRYETLPAFIRQNHNIQIDIRPDPRLRNVAPPPAWRQTTHAASVHASSAKSAIDLLDDLPELDVESALEELREYVLNLPHDPVPEGLNPDLPIPELMKMFKDIPADHPYREYYRSKVNAARRAVTSEAEDYVEPRSNITAKTFLAAGWFASNLEEKRMPDVTPDDARENIVRALYESVREYNLDKEGHDDGRPVDDSACGAGKFNKYAEYLSINLRAVELKSFPPEVTKFTMERFLKDEFRRRLSAKEVTLKDFAPPDEDGQVFCSESYVKKIGVKQFFDGYCKEEETSQEYRVRDLGFMEYLLCHTDFSSLLKGATAD